MQDNLPRFIDECNEVNATLMVETWDIECSSGSGTINPQHIAWDIASEISQNYEYQDRV
jgi:hypothetical protein